MADRTLERVGLAAIAAVAVALRLPTTISRATLGYDDGVYLASVLAMREGGRPFQDVYSSQGPAFLPLLRAGDLLAVEATWGPRLTPLLAAVAAVVGTYVLARHVASTASALLAAALVAGSGAFVYSTSRIESDGVAAALATLALVAATRASTRRTLAAGVLLGLAVAVKSLLVAPAAVAMVVIVVRQRRQGDLLAVTSSAIVLVVGLFAVWGWDDVWAQFVGLHLDARGSVDVLAQVGTLRRDLWRLDRTLVGIGAAAAAWSAARAARRADRERRDAHAVAVTQAAAAWLASGTVMLLVHDPLFVQHLTTLIVPAAVLVARYRPPWPVVLVVAGLLLPAHGRAAHWRLSSPALTTEEQAMVDLLDRVEPFDSLVVSDEPALPALAGRSSPGWLVDPSYVRIGAGALTTGEVLDAAFAPDVCAVLLWSGRLDDLPGLRRALDAEYHVVGSGRRTLLVRDGCRPEGTLKVAGRAAVEPG